MSDIASKIAPPSDYSDEALIYNTAGTLRKVVSEIERLTAEVARKDAALEIMSMMGGYTKLHIVERLLAPAYWISGSAEGHEGENNAPREAAAEIARLIARLREEVAWHEADKARFHDVQAAHLREITRLKAEVARLREFVLFVDRWTNYKPNKPHQPTSYENCVKTIAPMAAEFRAAITQEKTDV